MEYVNYKKIHRHKTRTVRLTIVEWPGGGITLETMARRSGGSWSGVSTYLTDASAKKIMTILSRVFASRRRHR